MSVWLTGILADIIYDVKKLGLYPEMNFKPEKGFVEYEDFKIYW